jgi:hypothetical protein
VAAVAGQVRYLGVELAAAAVAEDELARVAVFPEAPPGVYRAGQSGRLGIYAL